MIPMQPTAFRNFTLPAAGQAPARIVGSAPYPQRVVLAQPSLAPVRIFLATAAAELALPGPVPTTGVPPSTCFAMEQGLILSLGAGQALFAIHDGVAVEARLSLAISQALPNCGNKPPNWTAKPIVFRSYYSDTAIPRSAIVRLAPAAPGPQLVEVAPDILGVTEAIQLGVATRADEAGFPGDAPPPPPSGLTLAGSGSGFLTLSWLGGVPPPPAPGGTITTTTAAFSWVGNPATRQRFVLAPDQPLYGLFTTASGIGGRISVSIYDLSPYLTP